MNLKKLMCLIVALTLALSAAAMAEDVDALKARIAQLEAEVELYRPYYEMQVVAEYGDGGIIWREDAQAQYDEASAMYAQYGISVDDYAAEIKDSILRSMVQDAVLNEKAAELGLSEPDEAAMAELTAQAAEDLELYVNYYSSYFAAEGATEEETRAATIAGLAEYGIDQDAMLAERVKNYANEQLHNYITKDVAVTDEDIQAEYETMVEADKASYEGSDYAYNSARNSGETILWNPEGYRAVKQVLVKFSDEQSTQYNELQSTLTSLQAELDALTNPAETTEPAEGEEVAEPRTVEEIQKDMGEIGAAIEALYSELLPRAQEVIDAFNNGIDIDTLIAQYGEDPGMTEEPIATIGYAVSADNATWDSAFAEGAMSIAEIGQISEPVRGMFGLYILYYMGDIPAGAVAFEEVRDAVEAQALSDKIAGTYDDQVNAWIEEAAPVYHTDRF